MKRKREKVYQDIIEACRPIVVTNDRTNLNEFKNWIKEKYDVPHEVITDIIFQNNEETEATSKDFILFCLVDAIEQASYIRSKLTVESCFTPIEIKQYSKAKYVEEKIDFPLKIPVIQVEGDQWVAGVSSKFILLLRKAGLIKYNSETQRPLRKVINGENVIYKIELSEPAVTGIIRSYRNGSYIPNTWTLNISPESEADFYYDENSKELVINEIDHFDISDGYHRFVALCRHTDVHPDYETNIILQITQYDEVKAKSFIYQQDLKTKMKKVSADSMNMRAPEVKVCEQLNESSLSSVRGLIRRSAGIVDFPELSKCVKYFMFKNRTDVSQKRINDTFKAMRVALNDLVATYPELLEREWSSEEIIIATYICSKEDYSKILDNFYTYVEMLEKERKANKTKYRNAGSKLGKPTIDYVKSIVK